MKPFLSALGGTLIIQIGLRFFEFTIGINPFQVPKELTGFHIVVAAVSFTYFLYNYKPAKR